MEISDWILISSVAIVVMGWFVNSHFQRKHEISKIRTSYRIKTLKEYISFHIKAQEIKSLDGFNDIQVSFLLYGYDDEIELINKITRLAQQKNSEFLKLMEKLNILARNKLRTELGLPKVKK
jgi:hypothetical protein